MKTFTPSEFRADSGKVYNAVQEHKACVINHRDRPKMVLITESHLKELTENGGEKSLKADKQG